MPPTPADVIQHIEKARDMARDTDVIVWDKLRRALNECYRLTSYFGDFEELADGRTADALARDKVKTVWNSLPLEAQRFIGSEAEFIRKSKLDDKSMQIEESRFRKQFPDLRNHAKHEEKRLATAERKLIGE